MKTYEQFHELEPFGEDWEDKNIKITPVYYYDDYENYTV